MDRCIIINYEDIPPPLPLAICFHPIDKPKQGFISAENMSTPSTLYYFGGGEEVIFVVTLSESWGIHMSKPISEVSHQ